MRPVPCLPSVRLAAVFSSFAAALAGVGACGGDGGQPPDPVQRPPALTGAAVTPGAAEVPLDSAVALRAEPTWSGAPAGAPPAVAVTWTLRGTAGGVVTPDGGDRRGASYRAGGPGTDTLTASLAPAGGGPAVTAVAVVVVRGPRVARIAFPARVAYVGAGGTLALPAAGRDAAGAAVPKTVVTYRALEPAVATVGADGTLTGAAVGTTRIVAEASTVAAPGAPLPADTLRVVVAGDAGTLALGLADTVAQAGHPLTVVGVETGATATMNGTPVAAAAAAGGVTFAPPAGVFAGPDGRPCRPLGGTASLAVTSGGRTRTLALAVYAPYLVSLAPGQHRRVTEAAAGGCPLAVDAAGTYVAMPFAWDRVAGQGGIAGVPTPPAGAATQIVVAAGAPGLGAPGLGAPGVSAAGTAVGGATASRTRAVLVPRGWGQSRRDGEPGDVRDLNPGAAWRAAIERAAIERPTAGRVAARAAMRASGAPGVAGCPTPTALGATVPIGTYRAPDGRVLQPASTRGGGGVVEPWTLAAVRPSVAVFFDTALVRARGGLPGGDAAVQARLDAFADAYEATVAPLLARHTAGVTDADGNGRVVVLLALRAGNAYAFPTGYAREDCAEQGFVLGEAIQLGGDTFLDADRLVAPAVSVAAHESAHLVDNALAYTNVNGALRQDTWWSREGYAVLLQWLWTLPAGEVAGAFTAERAAPAYRTVLGTAQGGFCERPDRAVLGTWYTLTADGYPLACQAVRYALSQVARAEPGLTTGDLLGRWSALRDRRRVVDAVDGLFGRAPTGRVCEGPVYTDGSCTPVALRAVTRDRQADVFGAFALSWVADGVAGAAAETQDHAADVRALAKVWYPSLAVPAATLAPGGRLTATLGEPDVLHVEVTLPARGWVAVTAGGATGLPTDRADVLLMRVR